MPKYKKLTADFFLDTDVVAICRSLIGKVLVSNINDLYTSGIIVEAEAYKGPNDKASHSFNNRRTNRNEVMYHEGGHAYIYICYGIHHLFNVVTAPRDMAHAVLIRALEPLDGKDIMMRRRNMETMEAKITRGPGALSIAMGFHATMSGLNMNSKGSAIYIEDRGIKYKEEEIKSGTRIGVASAGEAAAYPWRFWVKGNKYVSANKN